MPTRNTPHITSNLTASLSQWEQAIRQDERQKAGILITPKNSNNEYAKIQAYKLSIVSKHNAKFYKAA